jgi:DnaA family protein
MQLPLTVFLPDEISFDSFYPGDRVSNQQAVVGLQHAASGLGERLIYLWGPESVGKTHLLQAACFEASKAGRSALYLPITPTFLSEQSVSILRGLENCDLLCIDDIEGITQHVDWQEAFFHLFNRLREQTAGFFVVSASQPPTSIPIELLDLKSRLAWGVTYYLQVLTDEEKLAALQIRAKARGIEFPDDVGQFLLRRCARNMADLYHILDQLDNASLVAQRKITIPFVKAILQV